jgi:hypothetical protein
MTTINLLSALGSYFTYDFNNPTGQGNGGNQIVLTFDHELNIAASTITAADISVEWNGITSTPDSITYLKRNIAATTANQILLSWSTQNPFGVPYFNNGGIGDVLITNVSIPAGALVASNTDTNISISGPPANGKPTSPAALPVLYAFTVDSTLSSYLNQLGYTTPANNIYVSAASGQGVSLWPGLAIPNGSSFTQGQLGGNADNILLGENYALGDLTSPMPVGGTTPQAWGLNASVSITKPWLSANLLQSARFYVSVPTSSTALNPGQMPWDPANLAATPSYQNVTSNPIGPTNTSGIGWQFFETYAAIQPGAPAFYSNYNYDTSYVDGFEIPISVNLHAPDGSSTNQSIDGGANRGQQIYTALNSKIATQNPVLQRAAGETSRLLAPSQTAQLPGVYHDFSVYLTYLGNNGITSSIVRTGDGGINFNYIAHFVNDPTTGLPSYIALQDNSQTNPQTLYLPYALANAPTGQTLSTGFVFSAVVPDPTLPITNQTYQGNGIYGGTTGYFIYSGAPVGGDYSDASKIFAIGTPIQQPAITNDALGVAVGDVLFGLNYGLIGSTVKYQGTEISSMPSDQWFGADNLTASSPVLAGYWGPWAWGNDSTQVQNNDFWNTWLFAMNGYVAPNTADYTTSGDTPLTSGSQLLSQVYGWAFADRVSGSTQGGATQAKLLNFGPINQADGSPSQAQPPNVAPADPAIVQSGYLEIILGAPGSPDGPGPGPGPVTSSLLELGFSSTSTPGEITPTTANLATNAFFSPFSAGLNIDRSLGTFDASDPSQQIALINRAGNRVLGSLDSTYGAKLADLSSAAIADAVRGTEGRSIGSTNTGLGRLGSTSFGTYDTTTTATYFSTSSPGVSVEINKGAVNTNFVEGSAQLALYTGIFQVSDSTGVALSHTVSVQAADVSAKVNGLVPYKVDDLTGLVNGLLPGDPGYLQAVLSSGRRLTSTDFLLSSSANGSFSFSVDDRQDFAFLLLSGGSSSDLISRNPTNARDPGNPLAFFSIGAANPDGNVHMLSLGTNSYGFEDLWGGGDSDFNDLVMSVRLGAT